MNPGFLLGIFVCMKSFSCEEPIAALASPWGVSAIGVIRTSGEGTLAILSRIFRGPRTQADLSHGRGSRLYHGYLWDGERKIDEIILAVYRKPRSYTGEDSAEIYCHGGLAIIQQILELLLRSGFQQAAPGEFTLRAFLNDKMDLTRAEAVNEIIRAKTDRARALALNRLSGAVERKVQQIKEALIELSAAVEVQIDYPDEDLEENLIDRTRVNALILEIEKLLSTYRTGKIIQEGTSVVIAGRTNAGKSTLFNLLLREDRAIVSEIHGTTRDYIEASVAIDGIPVRLFDTAGLRKTESPLELEGIKRTDQIIRNAELLLFLVDATLGFEAEDRLLLETYGKVVPVLPIWNKVDAAARKPPKGFLPISAETGEGLPELNSRITAGLLEGTRTDSEEPVIDSARQKSLLEACLSSVKSFVRGLESGLSLDALAVDLREALDNLGEITGEVVSEDILRKMFSRFCVGK